MRCDEARFAAHRMVALTGSPTPRENSAWNPDFAIPVDQSHNKMELSAVCGSPQKIFEVEPTTAMMCPIQRLNDPVDKEALVFFREKIESTEDWDKYERVLSKLSQFVDDSVAYLIDGFDAVVAGSIADHCYSHATVLMLTRHIIESIDGVSILAGQGCAQNCGPLLRSAFEGQLGVLYILEKDNKRRALAYQVAHCHRRIKMYRRCDPNDSLGKLLRTELKNDPIAEVFDEIPGDKIKMIANLEQMLLKPEFAPIELEWQAIRKNKDPAWFSLFGGPSDVRALAMHLRVGSLYEGLYRTWSDVIHAGSGFSNIGASDQPGEIAIRPIRHPEGLETACSLAAQICVNTARNLVETYASEKKEQFRHKYLDTISSRYMKMCKGKMIIAPWRKTQIQ